MFVSPYSRLKARAAVLRPVPQFGCRHRRLKAETAVRSGGRIAVLEAGAIGWRCVLLFRGSYSRLKARDAV